MSKLEYFTPAKKWQEALPLGNGSIAIMAYGGVKKDKLSVNDATLWSGYPKNQNKKECQKGLINARALIFGGHYRKAHRYAQTHLTGDYSEAFMPLADIIINYQSEDSGCYQRELDLNNAIFKMSTGEFNRECFVSHPDKVAVYDTRSKNLFSLSVDLVSKLKNQVAVVGDNLTICGNAPDYSAPNYLWTKIYPTRYNKKKAMAFALALSVNTDGAVEFKKNQLTVNNATYATLFVTTSTGFCGFDKMPNPNKKQVLNDCIDNLKKVDKDVVLIKNRHIADYRALYGRHNLSFGEEDSNVSKMLADAKEGNLSRALVKLAYDYGKYMTIAGSRDGQPLNLQGQWNASMRPPWSANLTTNINFEMNYWATASVNLAECLMPFYRAVKEISINGKDTASTNFGANGFCCNHNVDIWRKTSPVKGDPAYMFAPLCGAWLANEAYKNKRTSGEDLSLDFKQIILDAADFCLSYLTEHNGYLVTAPSASPEAGFIVKGGYCTLGYASAFEMGIIRQCFENCLKIVTDKKFEEKLVTALQRLYPFQKSSTGLAEWHKDFEISEKGHRHFSPLYGLYPGDVISQNKTPEVYLWAKELFEYRIKHSNTSIGWSGAWALCLAGKLNDTACAEKTLKGLFEKSFMSNLFGYHPPCYFQIDCNMGLIAGVNELLISEIDDSVSLLPACPQILNCGSLSRHKVNGAEITFRWENGVVKEIFSDKHIFVLNRNIDKNAILKNVTIRG